jgi:hypothetical protein
VLFGSGISVGKDLERAEWLERDQRQSKLVEAETERAAVVAQAYGTALNDANDKATTLRRKLDEQHNQLANCLPGGGVRFTPAFASLHDAALQSASRDSAEPTGAPAGAGVAADRVLDTQIENGRRWRACRDQLNALIDILEPKR